MNQRPPSDNLPDDIDEHYRRASALHPSHPSGASRQAVLKHAADLAAGHAAQHRAADGYSARETSSTPPSSSMPSASSARPVSHRARWRPAIFGGLAAAALAGLLIAPRFLTERSLPVASNAPPAAPVPATAPPLNTAPAMDAVPPSAAAPPSATASPPDAAPARSVAGDKPSSPPAEARSMAKSPSRSADASRQDAGQPHASGLNARVPMPPALEELATSRATTGGSKAAPSPDPAALRQAAESGDVHRVQMLLENQVSIDARDASGRTALMLAVIHGHSDAVDALLARGADPNAADARGTTPLQTAVATHQPAVAAALRRAGARMN